LDIVPREDTVEVLERFVSVRTYLPYYNTPFGDTTSI
jgi:hypothetical protein